MRSVCLELQDALIMLLSLQGERQIATLIIIIIFLISFSSVYFSSLFVTLTFSVLMFPVFILILHI